jgi:FlaG/FlaF family flagellin (archaellin)
MEEIANEAEEIHDDETTEEGERHDTAVHATATDGGDEAEGSARLLLTRSSRERLKTRLTHTNTRQTMIRGKGRQPVVFYLHLNA